MTAAKDSEQQIIHKARFALIAARFNENLVTALVQGAQQRLQELAVREEQITRYWVPGCYELPLLASHLAGQKKCEAIIALGVIIRGETSHFEYVAGPCSQGLMDVSLRHVLPVAFGVLTTENRHQALARAGGNKGNKGADAAEVAVTMLNLLQTS